MFARNLFRKAAPAVSKQSVRRMGHHAPPPTEGIEGFVRKFLPEDHHVVMGIMGFYVSLYFVVKAVSGGKKESAVEAAAPVVSVSSGDVPSIDSPEFDTWVSTPGNLEKLFQE